MLRSPRLWLLLASLVLFACGGGGGGGGGSTPLPFDLVGGEPGAASVEDVQTSFDGAGNGVAVWVSDSDLRQRLIGSFYSAATQAWSSEVLLATSGIYDGYQFELTRGPNDFAVLFSDGSNVYALSVAGGTFGAALTLDAPTDPDVKLGGLELVSGASGYVAAWSRREGGAGYAVRASVRTTGSVQWTPATKLSGSGRARDFAAAADGSNYLVVFDEGDDLYANYYVLGNWRGAPILMENESGSVSSMDLASNGSGFQVVWSQNVTGGKSIVTAAFDAAFVKSANVALATSDELENDVAIATDGTNYVVAYAEGDPRDLVARRGSRDIWSLPAVLDLPAIDDGVSAGFELASNGSGFAATWIQDDADGHTSLWANLYNGVWGPPVLLETGDGYVWDQRFPIVSDGTGYVIAWAQSDGPDSETSSIFANRFNGTTWSGAAPLDTHDGMIQAPPRFTLRGTQYVAAWAQQAADDSRVDVNVSGYNSGSGAFNPPANLARASLGGSVAPAGALGNEAGRTLLLWSQQQGLTSRRWAAVADATGGTGPAELMEGEFAGSADGAAASAAGFAVILRATDPGTGQPRVGVRRFDGQDWTDLAWLEPSDAPGYPQSTGIASDGSGYMAAWVRSPTSDGDPAVWASRWDGTAWSAPVLLSDAGDAQSLHIASNGTGYAVTWDTIADGTVPVNVFDGTSWSGVTVIATPQSQTFPEILSDGTGYLVHWNTNDPGAGIRRNYACVSPTGAAADFEPAIPVSGDTTHADRAESAASDDGYALVWTEDGGTRCFGRVRTGGAWSAAERIDATDRRSRIAGLAGGADGYAAVWTEQDGEDDRPVTLRARIWSGGAWEAAESLETSDRRVNPWSETPGSVVSAGSGYAAAWTQVSSDGLTHVFLSTFDGAGWTPTRLESRGASAIDVLVAPVAGTYSVFFSQPDPAGDVAVALPWVWLGLP